MATACLACRYLGVSADVRPGSAAPLVSANHDGYVLLQLGSNVLALYQRPTKQAPRLDRPDLKMPEDRAPNVGVMIGAMLAFALLLINFPQIWGTLCATFFAAQHTRER